MLTFELHVRVEAAALSPVKNNKGYNSLEWPYVDDDDDDDDSLEIGTKIFKI